jgi:hypothetical protein
MTVPSRPGRYEFRWGLGPDGSGIVQGRGPGFWGEALRAVGHDLALGQYNKNIDWLHWYVEVGDGERIAEDEVMLHVAGSGRIGLGIGGGVRVDTALAEATRWAATVTQDAVGDYNLAWPHRPAGGLLYARIHGEEAVWIDAKSQAVVAAIGSLHPGDL